jgi:predicted metal-binding membrane protein
MSRHQSNRAFLAIAALLFIGSAAITIVWSASMSAMPGMPMPGDWTMTMTWMPGGTRLGGPASFLLMWIVMMAAMMLPSLVPMLLRYRAAIEAASETRVGLLTALAAAGYFFVWTVVGLAVYAIGTAGATMAMQHPAVSRAVPLAIATVVVLAAALQFTEWKARQLACCREGSGDALVRPANAGAAWRHGIRLGFDCVRCCGNLMAILLVLGVMDLRVMAMVTAAITFERIREKPHTGRARPATIL